MADARPFPGRLPGDGAALGRGLRGVGRTTGAAAQDRGRGRPHGRPDGLHPPPVAAGPRLPARGAARDPAHRAHGPRPPVRQPLQGQRRARDRAAPRTGRRTPFGRRLARDFRAATGFALPDPSARPTSSRREGLRWLAWTRFSGRPLLRDEGGAGAPHPPARPGRRRETPTTTASSTASSRGTTPGWRGSPTWSRPTRT